MSNNIVASDATSLWKSFCSTANFDDSDYDADLERQVRSTLGLPNAGSMEDLLKQEAVCTEDLLFAVLSAMEPFSQMMNDLLSMFEKASIQYSNTNLQIQFDFDENSRPFQFDLDFFRKTVRSTAVLKKRVHVHLIRNPWTLIDIFDQTFKWYDCCNEPSILSQDIDQWLREYNQDVWPKTWPNAPVTGINSLDKLIGRLWNMIADAVTYYKQAYNSNKGRRHSCFDGYAQNQHDPLWLSEVDSWVGRFVRVITYTAERLNRLPPDEKSAAAKALESALFSHLQAVAVTTKEIEIIVTQLNDILSLPFWRKRHELYAAWVLTQITDALKNTGIQFHAPDGTLSFSFRATRMATCTKLYPPLDIWAELKTESSSVLSKKRKKHIQPDYTLAVCDASDPNHTVAVVECKQYKKANRKNFIEALVDYANGRPQAQVLLVNYGPVPQSISSGLPLPRSRATALGMIRPGSDSVPHFCEELSGGVFAYYRKKFLSGYPFTYPWQDANADCSIQLKWQRTPKDLDLYLSIANASRCISTVGFSSPGHLKDEPYAQLDADCRQGYGCETIRIAKWLDAQYDVTVDNYSEELEIDGSIDVSISCGPDHYSCSCVKPWASSFVWHVFQFNSLGFRIINTCVRKPS